MTQSSFGEILTRLWPDGDAKVAGLHAGIASSAPRVFARHGIKTPTVTAHVMAQISHECGAGQEVVENLNYSAARMMQVWPSRFPTLESAQPFARSPKALANKVYNGRMGNRPDSDDGWTFRGRGASQTTGRDSYQRLAMATKLDVVAMPELLLDPQHFLECGVADFVACGCLPYAERDDVVGVTRRLNGGTVGLAQRRQWLARWKAELPAGAAVIGNGAEKPLKAPAESPAPPPDIAPAKPISRLATIVAAIAALFRRVS